MSHAIRAVKGIAWSALGNWVQLGLNAVTFFIVVRQIGAVGLGAYGAAMLVVVALDTLIGPTLTQSLEQRPVLDRSHIDASLFVALAFALASAASIFAASGPVAAFMHAEAAQPFLAVMAIGVPLSALSAVPASLLSRELKFGELNRAGIIASLGGSLCGIGLALTGAGPWSLAAAELVTRGLRVVLMFLFSRYVPSFPASLTPLKDLARFNAATFVTFVFTYLDSALPRFVTSLTLGAASLGLLTLAQRLFDMFTQIVLGPMNRIMMTSIARLEADGAERRDMVRMIYRLATAIAYPGYIGLLVLAPDVTALLGSQWLAATVPIQIFMLVGLRVATGTFNFGILRGSGHIHAPMIILGIGFLLQAALVPLGTHWGVSGVTAMVLLRTLMTWPLGCFFVKRAIGLPIRDQLGIGLTSAAATLVMAAAVVGLRLMQPMLHAAAARLAIDATFGAAVFALIYLTISPRERRLVLGSAGALVRGRVAEARAHLRGYLQTPTDTTGAGNGTI